MCVSIEREKSVYKETERERERVCVCVCMCRQRECREIERDYVKNLTVNR